MRITDFSINKRLWLAIMFPLVAALALASMNFSTRGTPTGRWRPSSK